MAVTTASTVSFAGRTWTVKTSTSAVGPGPNLFNAANVSVDNSGYLHLKITKQNRKINADTTGAYLKSLAQKWVPKAIDANTIDTVAKAYVEKKLFPSDGGAATTDIEYTIKFFTDGGSLDKGLTVQQASDLTFLNTVLKALGPA